MVKVEALPSPVFWEVELYLRKRLCNQPDRTKKKIPTTFRPPPESMARLSGRKRGNGGGDDAGGGGGGEGDERSSGGRDGNGGPSTSPTREVSSGGSDKKRKTDDPASAVATAVTYGGSGLAGGGGGGGVNGEANRAASELAAVAPGPTPAAPVGGDVLAAPGVGTDESGLGSSAAEAVWEDGLFLADTSFREAGDGVGIDVAAAGVPL